VDVNTFEWASITGSATLAERRILGERLSSLFYENSLLGFISELELDVLGTQSASARVIELDLTQTLLQTSYTCRLHLVAEACLYIQVGSARVKPLTDDCSNRPFEEHWLRQITRSYEQQNSIRVILRP
jgi:hypothetical protein